MKPTDVGNEPTPNAINRRDLLMGTASAVALTAAIARADRSGRAGTGCADARGARRVAPAGPSSRPAR